MTNPSTGSKKVDVRCIEWACGRCRTGARLPQLDGATIITVRDAISRGHERRSFDCHMAHGIKHVRAVQDGKTLRFTASPGENANGTIRTSTDGGRRTGDEAAP